MNIGLSNEERKAVGMHLENRRRIFWGDERAKRAKRRNWSLSTW